MDSEVMPDEEIKRNLRRLGISHGPITRSTRRSYILAIEKAKQQQNLQSSYDSESVKDSDSTEESPERSQSVRAKQSGLTKFSTPQMTTKERKADAKSLTCSLASMGEKNSSSKSMPQPRQSGNIGRSSASYALRDPIAKTEQHIRFGNPVFGGREHRPNDLNDSQDNIETIKLDGSQHRPSGVHFGGHSGSADGNFPLRLRSMVSEYGGNNEPSLDRDSNEIMSDRKIRRNLRRLGIPQGPLTRSTRRLAMSVPASTNLLLLKTADNSSDYEDSLETINPCDNTRKISKLGRGCHSANSSYAMKAWGNLKRKLGDIFYLNSPKPRSIYNGRRCGQKWRLAGWWPTLLSILGILVAVSVPCIPHLKRDRITLLPAVLYGAFCDTFNGVVHSKMLAFVFCAFMAVIIVRMYERRRIRARAYAQRVQVREMREKIIQYMKTLKAIAIKLGLKDAFAPVDDVHDILIPFWQREATTVVWEKAVRYIGCHEKECHIQTKYVSLFGRGIAIWLYAEAADSNQEKEEEEWKDSIF